MVKIFIPDYNQANGEVAKHPSEKEDHIEERHWHHNLQKGFVIFFVSLSYILITKQNDLLQIT